MGPPRTRSRTRAPSSSSPDPRVDSIGPSENARGELKAILQRQLGGRSRLRVLDAGCGIWTKIPLGQSPHVVGVDIAEDRVMRHPLLAERVVADVQTHMPEPGAFDMVVCWDVLEHLEDPRAALRNLLPAVRPGGIAVFAFPNRRAIKGLVTRLTPHRAHAWYYRTIHPWVYGSPRRARPTAGSRGREPFVTHMAPGVSVAGVVEQGRGLGFDVVFARRYESHMQQALRRRLRVGGRLGTVLDGIVRLLSLGFVELLETDCLVVLQRRYGSRAEEISRVT